MGDLAEPYGTHVTKNGRPRQWRHQGAIEGNTAMPRIPDWLTALSSSILLSFVINLLFPHEIMNYSTFIALQTVSLEVCLLSRQMYLFHGVHLSAELPNCHLLLLHTS